MSTQISKIPLWSNWNSEYTLKITKIIKTPQKSQNVKKKPPDISQLTKIALKSLKRTKQPENLYNDQNTPETA